MINSRSKRPDLSNSWEEVFREADLAEEGAHIFAFHSYEEGGDRFEEAVYARHRLIWLEKDLLQQYGSSRFN